MRIPKVTPVNVPSDFQIGEMFFSTTDPKGIIESGNAVFARVSGYSLNELVGQPHNIIRHPDMPRVVFRLLWDYLHQGRSIAALVKNLAKDGRYYWVVALVTPVRGGYLSVRFKPSTSISEEVQKIYTRLSEIEQAHGDRGEDGRAGMDAAGQALGEELRRLGFADYDSFRWKFLHEEMKSREALAGAVETDQSAYAATGAGATGVLRSIYQGAAQAYAQINALYTRLDELAALHEQLAGKSQKVFELTNSIKFVALSTTIKAAKLGEEGRSLGVIAQYLSEASARTSEEVRRLTGHIADISGELHSVIFNLAGARLQLEMILFFGRELLVAEAVGRADEENTGVSRQGMIMGLQQAFHATMTRAIDYLAALGKHLNGLNQAADELRRTNLTLHVAQVGGKVEASRIRHDDSISTVLGEIHTHIEGTAGELGELGDIIGRFATLIRAAPVIARAIDESVNRIERDVRELSALPGRAAPAPGVAARVTVMEPAPVG